MQELSMKELLEAGVHFGHQKRRWNPKMARYIFTDKNDIYILDLQKTVRQMKKAQRYLQNLVANGGKVLLVSTKKQAQEIIQSEAQRANMYYVTHRWLGGTLTNFSTISRRIRHLRDLEKMHEEGVFERLHKKERSRLMKQKAKLNRYLSGIKEMDKLPDCIYVIDPRREHIPVIEARKLKIPVIGIVDTNCDPDEVDIVIPGNDDAIRAIKLITAFLVDGMVAGKNHLEMIRGKGDQATPAAPGTVETPITVSEAATPEAPAADAAAPAEAAPAEGGTAEPAEPAEPVLAKLEEAPKGTADTYSEDDTEA